VAGSDWVLEYANVTDFQLKGNRIGIIDNGILYVKAVMQTTATVC
jgi:hypothetical protein